MKNDENIELKASLLYYAIETGISKKESDFYARNIIAGNIDGIKFNNNEQTFMFTSSTPKIWWKIGLGEKL